MLSADVPVKDLDRKDAEAIVMAAAGFRRHEFQDDQDDKDDQDDMCRKLLTERNNNERQDQPAVMRVRLPHMMS